MQNAIEIINLTKVYSTVGIRESTDTLAEKLLQTIGAPISNWRRLRSLTRPANVDAMHHRAVDNLSLNCRKGEILGIVGPNGSGKSTLLRLIGRITTPTEGEIRLRGRISALLETGTGFHKELSGRENIYLNGALLGMKRHEINSRLDKIIEFSGVGKYIDSPLKFYSSGMRVRLGFSVAAWLKTDILLLDEVLAVGDADFKRQCLNFMEELAESGRTVLLVSHDMEAIEKVCTRAVFLNKGKLQADGHPREIISRYTGYRRQMITELASYQNDWSSSDYCIEEAAVMHPHTTGNRFKTGDDLVIKIVYRAPAAFSGGIFAGIFDTGGRKIAHLSPGTDMIRDGDFPPKGTLHCRVKKLPLLTGRFVVNLSFFANGKYREKLTEVLGFEVEGEDDPGGFSPKNINALIKTDAEWSIGH